MLYYVTLSDRINFIDENILIRGMNTASEFAAIFVRLRAVVEFIFLTTETFQRLVRFLERTTV